MSDVWVIKRWQSAQEHAARLDVEVSLTTTGFELCGRRFTTVSDLRSALIGIEMGQQEQARRWSLAARDQFTKGDSK